MISIGMLVKVPRGVMVSSDRPPGPVWLSHGKGSRPWAGWARSRKQISTELTGVVIETYNLQWGGVERAWTTVLIDGKPLQMSAADLKEFTKPSVICPHCHRSGTSDYQMKRWHFDNCKYK